LVETWKKANGKKVGRNLVEAENNLKTVESLLTKQTE